MTSEGLEKQTEALRVSEQILSSIEEGDLPFDQVLQMCKKLARLRDDFDAVSWFAAELQGYSDRWESSSTSRDELERYAEQSGRFFKEADKEEGDTARRYYTMSVIELETQIANDQDTLETLRPPANFTPGINKMSWDGHFAGLKHQENVVESYRDVVQALEPKRIVVMERIRLNRSLLSRIKSNVHTYILNVYFQLRFEEVTESIFQDMKVKVDKRLAQVCPGTMKKFLAAFNRLNSENPEEWSQAMSSCRNVLKEFADHISPARREPYKKKNGDLLHVTEDKYKNRLLMFLDQRSSGDMEKWLVARASDLETRLHALNDLLSRGTHHGMKRQDAQMCVIDTYLIIGSLLRLTG